MARGLGAFADGFAEGAITSQRMAREKAAIEADKKRMALEESRFALDKARSERDAEQFGLTKQLTLQQIEAGKRQGAEEQRKLDMRNQVSKNTQELLAWRNGQAPAPEWLPTVADGPMRKRGVGQSQPTPLDPNDITETQFRRLVNGIQQKALIDYGALDGDAIEKQVQFQKMIKNEGVLEAFDHFEKTQDSPRALKIFEKNGAFGDVPKGTFLRTERDPGTGVSDIVVYRPGPDGKPMRYTSRSEILAAMMPENLVKYAQDMNKSRYEQTQANKRNADSNATSLGVAKLNNAGAMDRALIEMRTALAKQEGKDIVFDQIKDTVLGLNEKFASNPNNAMDPAKFTQSVYDQMTLTKKLLAEGRAKNVFEAASMAMRDLTGASPK